MTRHSRYEAGFTLLEMLLALALVSILSASLYASLAIAYRARNAADTVLRDMATLELSLDMLRSDFESAVPSVGILAGPFIADDETGGSGVDADCVMFHTTQPPGSHVSSVLCDICQVELLLVEDEAEYEQLNLVRRVTTNLLATSDPQVTEQVLARGVQSFNLRYYDGLEWLDSWDSSTLDGELPLAVEITLQLGADESEEDRQPLSRVFMIPSTTAETQTRGGMEGFR